MKEEVIIELCGGQIPQKQTAGAAAYDLYAADDVFIGSRERAIVPAGFKIQLPFGYAARILPRSGNSSKGLEVVSTNYEMARKDSPKYTINGIDMYVSEPMRFNVDVIPGLIDSDYRGEVGIIVKNSDKYHVIIKKGQRIAQMLIMKVESPAIVEGKVGNTARGEGGFGSTGV